MRSRVILIAVVLMVFTALVAIVLAWPLQPTGLTGSVSLQATGYTNRLAQDDTAIFRFSNGESFPIEFLAVELPKGTVLLDGTLQAGASTNLQLFLSSIPASLEVSYRKMKSLPVRAIIDVGFRLRSRIRGRRVSYGYEKTLATEPEVFDPEAEPASRGNAAPP